MLNAVKEIRTIPRRDIMGMRRTEDLEMNPATFDGTE